MVTSVRAATMRIRFSDIIVKSKKVVEESGKDAVICGGSRMEIASLCGGSRMARNRWWMKQLGLVLKTTDDDDCDDDFYLEKSPRHRHGHDDYDLEEVIMQAFKEALQDICQVYLSVYSFIPQTGQGKLITLSHSRSAL